MVLTNCALQTLRIAGSSKNAQMSRPLNRVPGKVGYPSINQLIGVDWMPARKRTAVRSGGLPANKFYLFCTLLMPTKCVIFSTFFLGNLGYYYLVGPNVILWLQVRRKEYFAKLSTVFHVYPWSSILHRVIEWSTTGWIYYKRQSSVGQDVLTYWKWCCICMKLVFINSP